MTDMSTRDEAQLSVMEATAPAPQLLDKPEAALPLRLNWRRASVIIGIHVFALAAFLPYCFTWWGVAWVLLGHHLFGMLGISLCYHRLLTHRSLQTPKWFERSLATLGVCCLQDTPARWVAIHRMHHQESDKQPDPHTPAAGFLWSHMGWVFYENRDHHTIHECDRYAHDVLRDPYYRWLERGNNGLLVYLIHAAAFALAGFLIGYVVNGMQMAAGLQFATSMVVWGVLVRTVLVWHGTWSVNSLTHLAGYRTYETREDSRNNWFVALLSHGEGWHNNHHAKPRCANNRHRWWEFDLTYLTIQLFRRLGLATKVVELARDDT